MERLAGVGVRFAVDRIHFGNFRYECTNILSLAGSLNHGSVAAHATSGANVSRKG
jgi:hypothetical protein